MPVLAPLRVTPLRLRIAGHERPERVALDSTKLRLREAMAVLVPGMREVERHLIHLHAEALSPVPGVHQTQGVLLCDEVHEGEALVLGGGQVHGHVHDFVGVTKAVLVELGEQLPLVKSRGKVADHDSPHILAVAPILATPRSRRPLRRHCLLIPPVGVRHIVRRGAGGIGVEVSCVVIKTMRSSVEATGPCGRDFADDHA